MKAKLGQPLFVDAYVRGTTYMDGGHDISDAPEVGADLVEIGIGYICPHGIACRSCNTRHEHCTDCK